MNPVNLLPIAEASFSSALHHRFHVLGNTVSNSGNNTGETDGDIDSTGSIVWSALFGSFFILFFLVLIASCGYNYFRRCRRRMGSVPSAPQGQTGEAEAAEESIVIPIGSAAQPARWPPLPPSSSTYSIFTPPPASCSYRLGDYAIDPEMIGVELSTAPPPASTYRYPTQVPSVPPPTYVDISKIPGSTLKIQVPPRVAHGGSRIEASYAHSPSRSPSHMLQHADHMDPPSYKGQPAEDGVDDGGAVRVDDEIVYDGPVQ